MTINWQDLFTQIVTTLASGTVVLGAAAWLVKTLISHQLTREAEAFKIQIKADADAANEQLKSSLQMTAVEHQVRFSKLHEERAKVIKQVYQRLIEVEKGYGRFVLVDGYDTDTKKQQEAQQKTNQAMYDMSLFIEKHRIYLPVAVCISLRAFLDIMWHHAINVGVYGSISQPNPQTVADRLTAFRDAYDALQNELPAALAALEDEFRKLLGAADSRA